MKLTDEEKKLCAEWMEWILFGETYITKDNSRFLNRYIHFSPNDASLVVAEMVKQEQWLSFYKSCEGNCDWTDEVSAWLLTTENGEATNFFRSMYEWVKERKGK